MKQYLLDTHTIIWSLISPSKISKRATEIIQNPSNQIIANAVSFWEVSLKYRLGKLLINPLTPTDFLKACVTLGFELENLDVIFASTFHQLPILDSKHRDPFDRMLIWNAINTKRPIISCDSNFGLYESLGLEIIW